MKRITLLLLLLLTFTNGTSGNIPITSTYSLPVSSITKQQLIFLFSLREQYWETGEKVTVVLLPWDSEKHKEFVRNYLDVTPSRLRSAVEQRIDRGEAEKFIQVDSLKEALRTVSKIPGSVGYTTDYLYYWGSSNDSLKIITIRD